MCVCVCVCENEREKLYVNICTVGKTCAELYIEQTLIGDENNDGFLKDEWWYSLEWFINQVFCCDFKHIIRGSQILQV